MNILPSFAVCVVNWEKLSQFTLEILIFLSFSHFGPVRIRKMAWMWWDIVGGSEYFLLIVGSWTDYISSFTFAYVQHADIFLCPISSLRSFFCLWSSFPFCSDFFFSLPILLCSDQLRENVCNEEDTVQRIPFVLNQLKLYPMTSHVTIFRF